MTASNVPSANEKIVQTNETFEGRPVGKHSVEGGELELQSPDTEKAPLQQWNNPRINVWRVLGANFAFVIMG